MILSTLENGKVTKTEVTGAIFDHSCQVLVIGAGSAGVYAADSAARTGADVILCEIGENIGGMHVCGNVTGYYYGMRGGSFEEDDKISRGDTVFHSNMAHWEQRQIRLTERLQKSGVRLLCRHSPVGLLFEDGRVIGVSLFDGDRLLNVRASITVDATSDGHLIRMTDVNKEFGRPGEGSFAPFTVRAQYVKNGKLCSCNTDSGFMDHYCEEDFSRNTILAHANISSLFKHGEFVNLALNTGVREGLTFEGEERLSYEDILLGKRPEKILFWAYSDLDRHGSEHATEQELFQNWYVISNLSTVVATIPVPMGCVVPKGIKGLVTAGRCLSCDTYTQSAVRMNRDMFRMGECVGIAAALSALKGIDFSDVDYGEFYAIASERGCIEGKAEKGFYFDNSYSAYLKKMQSLHRTPDPKYSNLSGGNFICEPAVFDLEKSFSLLETDAPGVAIWSCCIATDREAVKERLYEAMNEAKTDLYRFNCAIALGLLNDTRALPPLREIIKNRDCFFFTDNRRTNQFRSAVAVCLLGRLGTEADLPLLYEILSDGEFDRPMYHTLKANYLYHNDPDRNFVYYAMITHTCMALFNIYKRLGLPMTELNQRFRDLFEDGKALKRVTNAKKGMPAHEETRAFTEYVLKITQS
ncbi:MAG: FAD-dependent oxidoreductase [Ruminococcaceae bacterium]|nr:FAD-dependent oxidoreductase [Oscillospiraceae bacterium]